MVVDVACGPGTLTLSAAQKAAQVKAIDFSENMISILRKTVKDNAITNIEPRQGDGQDLPYDNNTFDAAFSMFGLMFFPDRMKGYAEIHRTLKPGGKICISSWSPVSQSPLMQALFGGLQAIKPDLPDPKTDLESLENPEFFKSELSKSGFENVEIHGVSKSATFETPEKFWDDMVKGSAPVLMMKNNMPEGLWQEKRKIAIDYLKNTYGASSLTLSSDAWIGIGVKG